MESPFLQCLRSQTNDERSLLFHAVMNNQLKITRFLLENNDVNDVYNGYSLLMAAVITNLPGMIELLIDYGADLDYCDNNGNSALDYAILESDDEIIDLLLSYNAEKSSQSLPSEIWFRKGVLSLNRTFYKVCETRKEVKRSFNKIKRRQLINLVNNEKYSDIIPYLEDSLSWGFNPNIIMDYNNATPLMLWLWRNINKVDMSLLDKFYLIDLLISCGADINGCDKFNRTLIYDLVIYKKYNPLTVCLLDIPNLNVNYTDTYNIGYLHLATLFNEELVEPLLKSGVNVNIQDFTNNTAAHYCKSYDIFQLMKFYGVNMSLANDSGITCKVKNDDYEKDQQKYYQQRQQLHTEIINKYQKTRQHYLDIAEIHRKQKEKYSKEADMAHKKYLKKKEIADLHTSNRQLRELLQKYLDLNTLSTTILNC